MTKIDPSQGVGSTCVKSILPCKFCTSEESFSGILARVHRDIARRSIYYRVKRYAFERAEDGEITRAIVARRDANDRVK